MENKKDVYDRISEELDMFFIYSGQNVLGPMNEMLKNEEQEMYLMPTVQRRMIGVLSQLPPDQPLSIKELAAKCRVHISDISRELYVLEDKGYVSVKTSRQDRRVKLVQITPSGKAMYEECDRRSVHILREFFRIFRTDEQMEEVANCLHGFNEFCKSLEPERYFAMKAETKH